MRGPAKNAGRTPRQEIAGSAGTRKQNACLRDIFAYVPGTTVEGAVTLIDVQTTLTNSSHLESKPVRLRLTTFFSVVHIR